MKKKEKTVGGFKHKILSLKFYNMQPTITHKIFQTNFSFHVKVSFLFFKSFLRVLTKLSFWQGGWALGYHSLKFRHFPDIS